MGNEQSGYAAVTEEPDGGGEAVLAGACGDGEPVRAAGECVGGAGPRASGAGGGVGDDGGGSGRVILSEDEGMTRDNLGRDCTSRMRRTRAGGAVRWTGGRCGSGRRSRWKNLHHGGDGEAEGGSGHMVLLYHRVAMNSDRQCATAGVRGIAFCRQTTCTAS